VFSPPLIHSMLQLAGILRRTQVIPGSILAAGWDCIELLEASSKVQTSARPFSTRARRRN
ncbi:hypothetical protein, partial [Salmonella enterica]|uniref:hypothetical protein n=1 Tax=Salmonella enterica TaxID=28901 RepID=UPI0039E9D661